MKLFARLSRREQAWLALAAIVLFVIGINQLVLTPVKQEKRNMDRQILALQQQLAELKQIAQRAPDVKHQYQEFKQDLVQARSDEEMTSRLLGTVEELARTTGVSVTATRAIEPTRAADEAGRNSTAGDDWYRIYNIELTAHARLPELVQFLHRLNTGQTSLRVEVLDIAPRERESSEVRFTAKITQLAGADQPNSVL